MSADPDLSTAAADVRHEEPSMQTLDDILAAARAKPKPHPDISTRLCRAGRLSLILEPRDAWVGVYVARKAVYVALVPFVVIRWERR